MTQTPPPSSGPSSPARLAQTSVAGALAEARALGVDRLDAQVLLAWTMQRERTWLLAHEDALLDVAQAAAWNDRLRRRAAGEPLAYLTGVREFHGLALQVDARVLIPRPETEGLVDWALELLAERAAIGGAAAVGTGRPARLVDLGTGSGAIAIATAARAADRRLALEVHASDVSDAALTVARANAVRHGAAVTFRSGSWWAPWRGAQFDVAVSNPPYVAAGDPHLGDLRHEPTGALVAGPDGLAALRVLVPGAAEHLRPGGWLLLEHGWDQADAVQALLSDAGFTAIQTRRDLSGQPRCTGGQRPVADTPRPFPQAARSS